MLYKVKQAIAKIRERVPSWYMHQRLTVAKWVYEQFGPSPTDEEIVSFICALKNGCVAKRTVFERNKCIPSGGKEYIIYVVEDPETGALYKFAPHYWSNPRRQYDGVCHGKIEGDTEKFQSVCLKV